ncbi:MAG: response regulator transcription factor, partial [Candidatus Hydrogenedentes bacterium]|nr:response regulator transcription factor [Candidatus Hydrogenedentota bacterium]
DVGVAQDGREAIAQTEHNEYDVGLLDLEMPGMSGMEAMPLIRAQFPNLPIIVLTGFSDRIEEARENGATKLLTKPMSLHALEREVREVMARNTAGRLFGRDVAADTLGDD